MSICVRRFDPEVPMRRTGAQWLVGDDDGACDDAFLYINIKYCILSNLVLITLEFFSQFEKEYSIFIRTHTMVMSMCGWMICNHTF